MFSREGAADGIPAFAGMTTECVSVPRALGADVPNYSAPFFKSSGRGIEMML